jgi:hypothetical protein
MTSSKLGIREIACFLIIAWTACLVSIPAAQAQNVQHLSVPVPGGIPEQPVLTGIVPGTNGVTVTWDGPAGYYQLFEKLSLTDASWRALGPRTNLVRRQFVRGANSGALFRILGPAPHYAGSQACIECHQKIHDTVMNTRHASAGVDCENCHGAAANHAANPGDPTAVPRVEVASTLCGGCHTGPHQPIFEEWKSSPHSTVVEDMNPTNRIDSCGRCHSGTARLSLLQGKALPVGDANLGIVCIVCHDPHRKTANPVQLRNPIASTKDYFLTTSDVFTNKYNPNINICAQCHNHRGASWSSSSRAPHHSPQYNMLLGTVGLLASGVPPNQPASHALLIKDQCVGCHMQSTNFVSEAQPAVSGHSFAVQSFDTCRACHPLPEQLAQFATGAISNQVQRIKAELDLWAITKAPDALRASYGTRAWEYTTPGDLSPGGSGPSSSEQALVPQNIQKARFNLYLVLYDGSYGIHNAPFAVTLLDTAENWVEEELNK